MKLASLKDGTQDGQLVIVDSTLTLALPLPEVTTTMQQLLDSWDMLAAELTQRYEKLEYGDTAGTQRFSLEVAMRPLPRAYQWCDGLAYLSHAELVRKACKAEMRAFLYHNPLMYQRGQISASGFSTTSRLQKRRGASIWKRRSPSLLAIYRRAYPARLRKAPSGSSRYHDLVP
ncbi:hypothetical protein [Caballeronia sp. DA-9]|uniref:hypothetical protein n=1 Tax=Caballeronia sp. DA-9 TaxID=3436237 RepID=UPI003F667F2C